MMGMGDSTYLVPQNETSLPCGKKMSASVWTVLSGVDISVKQPKGVQRTEVGEGSSGLSEGHLAPQSAMLW